MTAFHSNIAHLEAVLIPTRRRGVPIEMLFACKTQLRIIERKDRRDARSQVKAVVEIISFESIPARNLRVCLKAPARTLDRIEELAKPQEKFTILLRNNPDGALSIVYLRFDGENLPIRDLHFFDT